MTVPIIEQCTLGMEVGAEIATHGYPADFIVRCSRLAGHDGEHFAPPLRSLTRNLDLTFKWVGRASA